MLLPYLCAEPSEGNMVWCANRKWLSGGDAWMVYREFDVLVRQPFGICEFGLLLLKLPVAVGLGWRLGCG